MYGSFTIICVALLGLVQALPSESRDLPVPIERRDIPAGCTPTPIASPSPKLHCGQTGVLKIHRPLQAFNTSEQGDAAIAACQNACLPNSKCLSFSANTESGQCQLWKKTLSEQGFTKKKNTIVNYGRACFGYQCEPVDICDNQGLEWAYYDVAAASSDPTDIKTETPTYNATTTYVGLNFPDGADLTIYGSSQEFFEEKFVINHRGYLFTETDGAYNFAGFNVDDNLAAWVGAVAYSGWSDSNPVYALEVRSDPSGNATLTLKAGNYVPIRFLYHQDVGAGSFNATITAPNGTVLLDYSTGPSSAIFLYGCDPSDNAPAYPPFGSET